jgi:hypothetical protein
VIGASLRVQGYQTNPRCLIEDHVNATSYQWVQRLNPVQHQSVDSANQFPDPRADDYVFSAMEPFTTNQLPEEPALF